MRMNDAHFDALARALATSTSRRAVLAGMAAAALANLRAAISPQASIAQDSPPIEPVDGPSEPVDSANESASASAISKRESTPVPSFTAYCWNTSGTVQGPS